VTDAERIDALERRVRELEARAAQVPVYIPVYVPVQPYAAPAAPCSPPYVVPIYVPMPKPLYPRWWEVTFS
jgi:hypothetical protein